MKKGFNILFFFLVLIVLIAILFYQKNRIRKQREIISNLLLKVDSLTIQQKQQEELANRLSEDSKRALEHAMDSKVSTNK